MPTGSCPSCGADLTVKRGDNRVSCYTCGAAFQVKRAMGRVKLQQIDTIVEDFPSPFDPTPDHPTSPTTNYGQAITPGPGLSQRYWLADTGHAAFVDGQTDRPNAVLWQAGCGLLFMIPFVAVGLFVFGLTIKEWTEWYRLDTAGEVVSGRYEDRWITTSSDNDNYYTAYFFYVNDAEYHDQIESRASYNRFEMGAPVAVLYWPDNPAISSLADYFDRPSPFHIIFTLFWNSIVSLFVVLIAGGAIRQMRMNRAQDKILIEGQVLRAKGRTASDDDFQLTMEVTFQSPQTGKLLTARAKGTHNNVSSKILPAKGKAVLVLYANDDLHEIM